MSLIDEAGRARIEAAIADAERLTAGEIVVVTVRRCDAYVEQRVLFSACCALAIVALLHWLQPALAAHWLLWLQLPAAGLCMLVSGWAPLLRLLVPHVRRAAVAERRARLEFLDHAVFATRDRTGLLILLCEAEREVVILGDAGVHAHVKDSGWRDQVHHIVAAIHAGDPARGVCDVIAAISTVLAQKLPVRGDDKDELPNRVRQG